MGYTGGDHIRLYLAESQRSVQVVREQCWLNELLLSCQWTTDVVEPGTRKTPPEKSEVTDADLDALLSGMVFLRDHNRTAI